MSQKTLGAYIITKGLLEQALHSDDHQTQLILVNNSVKNIEQDCGSNNTVLTELRCARKKLLSNSDWYTHVDRAIHFIEGCISTETCPCVETPGLPIRG